MSIVGSFDRTKHLSELDTPLDTAEGVLSPAMRRARMHRYFGGASPAIFAATVTSYATVGAQTYTAAAINGGLIVRDCAGASRSDTFPTAALLLAAYPGLAVGDVISCKIVNGSDPITEVLTLVEGAGMTWDANQTAVSRVILGASSKHVYFRFTNVTAGAVAAVIYA